MEFNVHIVNEAYIRLKHKLGVANIAGGLCPFIIQFHCAYEASGKILLLFVCKKSLVSFKLLPLANTCTFIFK